MHEVFVGDLEGRSDEPALEEFHEVYDAWWRGELDAHAARAGSRRWTCGRGSCPPSSSSSADGDGDVVLVSHGAAIRLAAGALLGDTTETWYVPNTGLVVLRRDAGGLGAGVVGHGRAGARRRHGGRRPGLTGRRQPQPSRCRVSSSIPKWCATSCTTVTATSSTTSSSSAHTSRIASR